MFGSERAPALVGIYPKAHYSEQDEQRAVQRAVLASRQIINPTPVLYGPDGRVLGWAWAERWGSDRVLWAPGPRVPLEKLIASVTSTDDVVNGLGSEQSLQCAFAFSGTSSFKANNWWNDMWPVGGGQPAGTYSGSAFTARGLDDTSAGSIWHGGNVSPKVKLAAGLWWTDTNSGPNDTNVIVYDRVATYEACTFSNGATQTLTQTGGVPARYASGAPGLQVMITLQTMSNSASSKNLTSLAYTNQAGNAANMPTTGQQIVLVGFTTGSAPGPGIPAPVLTSIGGNVANASLIFLPLAAGDTGVRTVTSYKTSTSDTGTFAIVLCQPLAHAGCSSGCTWFSGESDLVHQLAMLQRVYDGACLSALLCSPTSTGHGIAGHLDVCWN